MPEYVLYNGKMVRDGNAVVSINNRSFRYGDGFFETVKVVLGEIRLKDLHFNRLFHTLSMLHFDRPKYLEPAWLEEQILELLKKNGHTALARVRITVYRGDHGLYDEPDNTPHVLIQTWELNAGYLEINENGLVIDVFKDARKIIDAYSHLKTNNYQPYVLGALWAKQNRLNDAVILNSAGRVAESTIANIFLVDNDVVRTPALTEGCIGGVARRYLIDQLKADNIYVEEAAIGVEALSNASEIFLTNAISGIRWVKSVGDSHYSLKKAKWLFDRYFRL